MSLKNKDLSKYYKVGDFLGLITRYQRDTLTNIWESNNNKIEEIFDRYTSDIFGGKFKVLWNSCNRIIEKIECIFLLERSIEEFNKKQNPWEKINFFKEQEVVNFITRTKHYLKVKNKTIKINDNKAFTKEWVVIIDKTDNHFLESINKPQINEYHYNFTHAKTIKQQQDIINGMWSQHFAKEKINMENYRKSNFNFTTLKRKVNAFARHPIEDEDRLSREKWGAWSEEEKKQELQELFWKMLIWKILNKKKIIMNNQIL